MTTPHVCILTTAHPLDDVRVNSKIAASFLEHGWRVSWVGPKTAFFTDANDLNPRIEYHLTPPLRGRVDRVLSARRVRRKAAEVRDADVYYSPDPDAAGVATQLGAINGAKVVFDIHEVFHGALLDRWLMGYQLTPIRSLVRRRIAKIARKSTLVIGVNASVLRPYVTPETPSLVVRNSAPAWFTHQSTKPMPTAAVTPHGGLRPMTFMHGKALPSNGTPVVLEALSLLDARLPSTRVVMFPRPGAGSPLYLPDLNERIEVLGVGSSVWKRDSVPHHLMPAVLRECQVGLIAYGRGLGEDSLPNRLFEYMASGLAILAPSYSHEIAQILEAEDIGRTVDFDNASEVATAITWFHEHPVDTEAMGRRAQKAFEERYSWSSEFDRLIVALDRELAPSRPSPAAPTDG